MISYEVSFGLIVISFLCLVGSFSLIDVKFEQTQGGTLLGPLLPATFLFIITGVAETNRAPFDLAESESELVSGFNVEYSGMAFALFFLAEYASILFFSLLAVSCFIGGASLIFTGNKETWLKFFGICFIFVWLRSSFPRVRYDVLMRVF